MADIGTLIKIEKSYAIGEVETTDPSPSSSSTVERKRSRNVVTPTFDMEPYCFDDSSDVSHSEIWSQDFLLLREKIFEWQLKVIDALKLDRKCVYFACQYLDRYVWNQHTKACNTSIDIDRSNLQLLSMVTLFLATKVHESRKGTAKLLHLLTTLDDSPFTKEDIFKLEGEILFSLDWRVHPVSPQDFLESFGKVVIKNEKYSETWTSLLKTANPFAKSLQSQPDCSLYKASSIAIASLRLGIRKLNLPLGSATYIEGVICEIFANENAELNAEVRRLMIALGFNSLTAKCGSDGERDHLSPCKKQRCNYIHSTV